MGKGNFLTTLVRGKLGNMVGYKVSNSNNKEKQGWRSYVPIISNPKSSGQARQRMIVANLTRNYGTLQEIISRGFEGLKYGGQSYNRFLKLNMPAAKNGPYIPKGSRSTPLPIPGLQLSEGSLIPIAVSNVLAYNVDEGGAVFTNQLLLTDIYYPTTGAQLISADITWGQVSAQLIAGNTDIQDGDQLTFVSVSVSENLEYVYRYKSVIIDITSDEVLGKPHASEAGYRTYGGIIFLKAGSAQGNNLTYSLVDVDYDEVNVAGAVIQSRKDGNGNWKRSNSTLWVNMEDEEIAQYFSAEMFQLAIDSYMNGGLTSAVDWPTEPMPVVTEVYAKIAAPYSFTIDDTSVTANVAFASGSEGTRYLIVKTENGSDYATTFEGDIAMSGDTKILASAASPAIATINVTELAAIGL